MRRQFSPTILFAALLLAAGTAHAQRPSAADPMYTEMRNSALSYSARDLGVTPRPGETQVYGVVMDIDINGSTATVISYVSGDASLYLSNGGGTIGGIGRPPVAAAARALVAAVTPAHLGSATRVTSYPRPNRGETRFYLLTTQGVHMATRPTAALEAGTDAFAALFAGGHAVISGFREENEVPRSGN
jgi:hypothetical protein